LGSQFQRVRCIASAPLIWAYGEAVHVVEVTPLVVARKQRERERDRNEQAQDTPKDLSSMTNFLQLGPTSKFLEPPK
jgi:hypothetical protein